MADETTSTEEETPPAPAEVTEDDLRKLIGEVFDQKLEEKLGGITEGIGGAIESVFEKMKGETGSEDSLLEKIGGLIDEKLKGFSTGTGNAKKEHVPKIRIFS